MSLDYDHSKIHNRHEKYPAGPDNEINPITWTLTLHTLNIGFNSITKENWEEFYQRVYITEKLFGPFMSKAGENGGIEAVYITAENVRDHIGLRTNTNIMTAAQFKNHVWRYAMSDAKRNASRVTEVVSG